MAESDGLENRCVPVAPWVRIPLPPLSRGHFWRFLATSGSGLFGSARRDVCPEPWVHHTFPGRALVAWMHRALRLVAKLGKTGKTGGTACQSFSARNGLMI